MKYYWRKHIKIYVMKYLHFLFLLFFMSVIAWGQDMNAQKRDITLKILNKKGRPVKNIMVQSIESGNAGITDLNGLYVFKNMTDDDRISILLPKYGETIIPVDEMDSIVVNLLSTRIYTYENSAGEYILSYH